MLVVLILVAVGLGPLWGARLGDGRGRLATGAGWMTAMAVVLAGAATSDKLAGEPDVGFWVFNVFLLVAGLMAATWGARRHTRAELKSA